MLKGCHGLHTMHCRYGQLFFFWVMTKSKRGKEGRSRKEGTERRKGGETVLEKTEQRLEIQDRNEGVVVN